MAFYTAAQLYGTGSVGENLSGATTFTFVNSGYSSYFTLETNPNSTGSFAGRPTCASGSWNVSASMFPTTGAYVASVVVQPGSSSLIFTPPSTVTGTDYHLRGTGVFTLQIGASIPVTASSFVAFGSYSTVTTPPGGYFDIANYNVWYTASLNGTPSAFTLANSKLATGSAVATDGQGNWVMVGVASGSYTGSYSIFNSVNGKTWVPVDASRKSGSIEYRSVAWGYLNTSLTDKVWVAAGSGSIAKSPFDVNSWSYTGSTSYNGLRAVSNGKDGGNSNLWLAVGDVVTPGAQAVYGYYTSDVTGPWSSFTTGIASNDVDSMYSLCYDDQSGLWVVGTKPKAGGANYFLCTSTDPITVNSWTSVNASANIFTTACYAVVSLGSNWIIGGDANGQGCLFRFDGATTVQSLGVTLLDTCYSLAYDGTTIVAVGKKAATNGVVIYSTDGGGTWNQSTSTTPVWKDGFAVASATGPNMYPAR
jgi:hypothetical protein